VLVDNYSTGDDRFVGFTVKGARHFLQPNGIPFAKSVHMSTIITGILDTFPGTVVEWFVEIVARPMSEDIKEVDVNPVEMAV
jgi:hypothetical protein